MHALTTQFAITLCIIAPSAWADWVDPGAVYLCDVRAKILSIKSVMNTSSPEDLGTVPAPPHYLPVKSNRRFKCIFGTTDIHANIEVEGAHPSGSCAGFVHTYIHTLQVNGQKIFPGIQTINSACFSDPELNEIEIKQTGKKTTVKLCYATWDWGRGYTQTHCDTQLIAHRKRIVRISAQS